MKEADALARLADQFSIHRGEGIESLVITADRSDSTPDETAAIDFTPEKAAELTFACGMNMMRGKLIVEGA
jgi:plastocyanin domain-containing protein